MVETLYLHQDRSVDPATERQLQATRSGNSGRAVLQECERYLEAGLTVRLQRCKDNMFPC